MEQDSIQIYAVFHPFHEPLKLMSIQCSPTVSNINPVFNGTTTSAYDEWFTDSFLLSINGDFQNGTRYQFTLRFLDDYGKTKTVYIFVDYVLEVSALSSEGASKVAYVLSQEIFGEQHLFWTPLGWPDIAEPEQVRATLLSVGTNCYVYMANSSIELLGEPEAISKCDDLRLIFDDLIYPKAIELAGHPDGNLGDIDGDPRVTLFLAPLVRNMGSAYLGFHQVQDEFPVPFSNLREMVFIDAERELNETIITSIHEFNHLIWFNHEIDEADFLTEGLANLAVDYTGYWSWVTDAVTNSFTNYPQISLLYFNRFYSSYWDASYGQGYLFVTYLWERFGVDFVSSLVSIPEDGALAIDVALANQGYTLTFNDVYLDWITACVIDNPEIDDGIYGFTTLNYTVDYSSSPGSYYPIQRTDITHNHYGIHARRIYSPMDSQTFQIENPQSYALGISVVILDNSGWSVTQSIHTEQSSVITKHITGSGVQEIYIITSLMSQDTPTEYGDVYALDEVPSVELTYTISEYVPSLGSDMGLSYLMPIFGTVALVICGAAVVYRRRIGNKGE